MILVETLPDRAMTNYCRVAGADASIPPICVLTVNSAMLPVMTAIPNAGADTLEAISCALNQRESRSLCGAPSLRNGRFEALNRR